MAQAIDDQFFRAVLLVVREQELGTRVGVFLGQIQIEQAHALHDAVSYLADKDLVLPKIDHVLVVFFCPLYDLSLERAFQSLDLIPDPLSPLKFELLGTLPHLILHLLDQIRLRM